MSHSERQVVIVLGMHRSGTSALAGVLSLLGACLPARLMPAGPGNPKGYFEPGHIVTIHNRILAAAATAWAGWELVSESWLRSEACEPFVEELAAAVIEDYGSSGLFVVKDPRMCRLMPLWFRVLERIEAEASFVLPFRNPVEVARSMQQREGLPLPHGCVAWLRSVLDAEHQTRRHPRAFLNYGDLVADPACAVERVVASLPLDWPRRLDEVAGEICKFVDPNLRHQVADRKAIDDMGEHSPWLHQALRHYEALARDRDDGVLAQLDELRADFDAADSLFTPAYKHDAEAHAAERQIQLVERQAEATALQRLLSERDRAAVVLGSALSESQTKAASLDRALEEAKAQLAVLDQAVLDRDKTLALRAGEIADRDAKLASLDRELAERNDRLAALWSALSEAEARHSEAEARLSEAEARVSSTQSALTATVAEFRSSTSWRLTAPLRSATRLIGRLRLSAAGFPIYLCLRVLKTRSRAPLRDWRAVRVIARSGLFDAGWYLRNNPDVAASRVDPIRHYVAFGAAEGRDPSPSFGTQAYVARYPDVAAAQMNPLAHFISFGIRESRISVPTEAFGPVARQGGDAASPGTGLPTSARGEGSGGS